MPGFFDLNLLPHGLSAPKQEIYSLALQEAMAHLNETCRYPKPEEYLDVYPEDEFEIIPNENKNGCAVYIKAGIPATTALDAMFHDIISDCPPKPKVIECLAAVHLVALQAARYVIDDDDCFNCIVDKLRGGRDKAFALQTKFLFPFEKFGTPNEANFKQYASSHKNEIQFGHMRQPFPNDYSKKHSFLPCLGFNFILLPDGSVITFAPDNHGKFESLKELAKYMLAEMNADLSLQEWCQNIRAISKNLRERGIKPSSPNLLDTILQLAATNLPLLIKQVQAWAVVYKGESNEQQFLEMVKQCFNITDLSDVNYITSLCLSLEQHCLPLKDIKVSESDALYQEMEQEAKKLCTAFHIRNLVPTYESVPSYSV